MTTGKLDLDLTVIVRAPLVLVVGMGHNLDRQKTRLLRSGLGRFRGKARGVSGLPRDAHIDRLAPRAD